MVVCPYTDCGYKQGHTHTGGEANQYIKGAFGEFFNFSSGSQKVEAWRLPNTIDRYPLLACPKCKRTFISMGETYEV